MFFLFSQEVCVGGRAVSDFGLAALMSGGSLAIPGKWLCGHFKHVNGSAGHDHLLCEVGSAAFGIPRGGPPGLRKGGGMYVYIGSR